MTIHGSKFDYLLVLKWFNFWFCSLYCSILFLTTYTILMLLNPVSRCAVDSTKRLYNDVFDWSGLYVASSNT